MALKVGELFASFGLDTSGVDGAISSIEKKLSGIGKSMMTAGAGLTAAVTVPIAKLATSVYEAGSGFDAQMSKVFAIMGDKVAGETGLTGEALQQAIAQAQEALRQEAIKMGSTTSFTSQQAGEALQYMAMAGWDAEASMAALAPIMNLAAASGEDLGTVSDIVTDSLTAFKLEAGDASHFADVLAAASSNSNTNVAIMGESFKYIAPLAGSLGYSIEDVATALGLMANAGIKGSMAGTSLRQVISNMISPTDAQKAAMEALGVSLTDSNGAAKSLSDIMLDLRQAAAKSGFDMQALRQKVGELDAQLSSGTITQEQYDKQVQELTKGNDEFLKAISDLAGARGLSGLLAIMNASEGDFEKLSDSVNKADGTAQKMADTMLDNAAGSVKLLQSAAEGLEITLWDLVKDGFTDTVKGLTAFIDRLRTADKRTQKGTLKLLGLAAAAGPVLTALGGITAMLPVLAKGLIGLTGPAGLLALGLVSIGAAAIDSEGEIPKAFDTITKSAADGMWNMYMQLKGNRGQIQKNVKTFASEVGKSFRSNVWQISRALGGMIGEAMNGLAESMPEIRNLATSIVGSITFGLAQEAPGMVQGAAALVTQLVSAMIESVPQLTASGLTLGTAIWDGLVSVDWGQYGTNVRQSLEKSLGSLHNVISGWLFGEENVFDPETGKAVKLSEHSWEEIGEQLVLKLRDGMSQGLGALRDFFGKLLIGETYSASDSWAEFGTKLIDSMFAKGDAALGGAADFVGGIIDGIGEIFTDEAMQKGAGTLSEIAGRLIGAVFDEIPKLTERAGTLLEKIAQLILGDENTNGLAASALDAAAALAASIFTAIEQGMEGGDGSGAVNKLLEVLGKAFSPGSFEKITGKVGDLITAIFQGMSDVLPGFAAEAAAVLQGIIDLLFVKGENGTGLIGSALESIRTLLRTILESVPGLIGTMGSAASGLVTAIADAVFTENENGQTVPESLIASLTGIVSTVLTLLATDIIPGLAGTASQIVTTLFDVIFARDEKGSLKLANILNTLSSAMSDVLGLIVTQVIPGLGSEAAGVLQALFGAMFRKDESGSLAVSEALDAVTGFVRSILEQIPDAITAINRDFLKPILTALGSVFTTDNLTSLGLSFGGLADAIISGIGDAIVSVFDNLADLAGRAAEGMEGEDSAVSAGVAGLTAFFEKILTALANTLPKLVTSGGSLLAALGELAANLVKGLVTALTGIGEKAEGKIDISEEAGSILESILTALNDAALGLGGSMASILTTLGNSLFGDDGGLIESALSGAKDMALSLSRALAQGIRDNHSAAKNSGLQDAVFGFISDAISTFPSVIDAATGVIEGGAAVANAIMESIAGGLTDLKNSDVSTALNSFASDLPSAIFEKIGDLASNADVLGFLENLGTALYNGLGTVGEALGNFVGGLLKLMFTPEGWAQLWDTGKKIANFLWEAIKAGFNGVTGFIQGIIDGILNELGVIDSEKIKEVTNLKNLLVTALTSSLNEGSGDAKEKAKTAFAALVGDLFTGGDEAFNQFLGEDSPFADLSNRLISEWMNGNHFSGGKFTGTEEELKQAFVNAFSGTDFEAGFSEILKSLPDDFWKTALESFGDGKFGESAPILKLLIDALFGGAAGDTAAETAEKTAETISDEATAAAQKIFGENSPFASALEGAGKDGMDGISAGMAGGLSDAEATALSASDTLVKDFMLTLSFENGMSVGAGWMQGVIAGFVGWDARGAARAFVIGANFGQGFVRGIESKIKTAEDAARRLGTAAGNALSEATKEGSPSKWTESIGLHFDQGFINGIDSMMGDAADMARDLGQAAGRSLNASARDLGRQAVTDTQYAGRNGAIGGGLAAGRQNGPDVYALAAMLYNAVSGISINMDGTPVGRATAPTVSDIIASNARNEREAVV